MKFRLTTLLGTTAAATALLCASAAWADTAPAAPAAPPPSPAPYPAMSATLSANPHPFTVDAGPIGKLTVTGVISGGGFYQSNPIPALTASGSYDDPAEEGYGDLTNALVMVQKTDGPVQFFFAGGAYSFAALGGAYYPAVVPIDRDHDALTDGYITQTQNSFGWIPEAFVKIVPNANWSIQAGLLPTVVGDEYAFTFENMNIQRGLLWNQENLFDQG